MSKRIYFPDGRYRDVAETQPPDLVPVEIEKIPKEIKRLQKKYAGKKAEECFVKMKDELEKMFASYGLGVEVRLITLPVDENEIAYLQYCNQYGYLPIAVEITHRLNWKEGDHEKELYEWSRRKRAISDKKLWD